VTPLRIYVDEDVYGEVAPQLRRQGFDASSVIEAGRSGFSDPDQLQWAVAEGRAMITFNVGDFARLHSEVMSQGGNHAGIIVSAQIPLRIVLRRLLHLLKTLGADEMQDRLEYLSNW
jgi:hypothetical protein